MLQKQLHEVTVFTMTKYVCNSFVVVVVCVGMTAWKGHKLGWSRCNFEQCGKYASVGLIYIHQMFWNLGHKKCTAEMIGWKDNFKSI